ncbi:MAG TPA: hypothetical protein VHN39_04250 [Phenylobacterium sp.]|nr:hypothetical protein [Phenylobacterium sp.]
MRSIAEGLMVFEAAAAGPGGAAFPVTGKLAPHLATLVGRGGVRALMSRALVLAATEVAWLQAAQVNADGDVEGLKALGADLDPADFLEGRVVLLAQLLWLLVVFIGPSLTSRLVGEIWPDVPLKARNFGKEHRREKAK